MRILVLGGYGLIGSAISYELAAEGHDVVGLGRDAQIGNRRYPSIRWVGVDMAALTSIPAWSRYLKNIDIVINAAGALQDSVRDDLDALHHKSVEACLEACAKYEIKKFIQISVVGARSDANTAFMRTKAAGDAAVRASDLDWVIFKPGLVIGKDAYGGTAILRLVASMPGILPILKPAANIMTIQIDDITASVRSVIDGNIRTRQDYDLVSDERLSLRGIVIKYRRWLGFAHDGSILKIPSFLGTIMAKILDFAGVFGWRSPLNSTSLKLLNNGIVGDAGDFQRMMPAGRPAAQTLDEFFASAPATSADRVYSRAQILIPMLVVVLSFFWLTSGGIALTQLEPSAGYISAPGGLATAKILIVVAAIVDIVIGFCFLVRPMTKNAAIASVLVSLAYLFAGVVYAPSLWLDPLAPFLKIFPTILPSIALLLFIDDR